MHVRFIWYFRVEEKVNVKMYIHKLTAVYLIIIIININNFFNISLVFVIIVVVVLCWRLERRVEVESVVGVAFV